MTADDGLAPAYEARPTRLTPNLTALFRGFLMVSLCGFGGPIVWARRIIVDRLRWLGDEEFAELLGFCQFMPGPNMVSMAVCTGARFRGAVGALAALAGFIVLPCAIGFAFGAVLLSYAAAPAMQGILRGISAAAAGLMLATGIRLLMPHRRRPAALLFAGAAFAALAFARLPLTIVVPVLVPLSIIAARPASA